MVAESDVDVVVREYLLILYHFLFDGLKERRNDPRCDKTINATSSPREIVAAILTAITFDRGPRA